MLQQIKKENNEAIFLNFNNVAKMKVHYGIDHVIRVIFTSIHDDVLTTVSFENVGEYETFVAELKNNVGVNKI